jgi:UDP-glucose 4-epimerase
MNAPRILVTGAAGYLGSQLVASLASHREPALRPAVLVATDVREVPAERRLPGVVYANADIRSEAIGALLREHAIDDVVHLAAIVTPSPDMDRAFLHSVEVEGTRRLLEACVACGVRRITVTSSGAAYGYYPDNPPWIDEDRPLRGNPEFAYSDHKRQVEEMLADYRARYPQLGQLVLRVCTILGERTANQITALFERKRLIAIKGPPSPFVFIWDQDVVGAIEHGIATGVTGIYNVAGDGAMSVHEIAKILGKPVLELPAWLLQTVFFVLRGLRLSPYGPEQVNFLRYRPVLGNRRLKERFGYVPRLSSAEVFELFRKAHGLGPG